MSERAAREQARSNAQDDERYYTPAGPDSGEEESYSRAAAGSGANGARTGTSAGAGAGASSTAKRAGVQLVDGPSPALSQREQQSNHRNRQDQPPPQASTSLYSQQNHSTPALAFESSKRSSPSQSYHDPATPSIDDISVGIEGMWFQQRSSKDAQLVSGGQRPHDGAMEIRGRDGSASVYSLEAHVATSKAGGSRELDPKRASTGTYDDGALDSYYEGRSEGGDYFGYDDASPPPSSTRSHPAQPYPSQQQQHHQTKHQPQQLSSSSMHHPPYPQQQQQQQQHHPHQQQYSTRSTDDYYSGPAGPYDPSSYHPQQPPLQHTYPAQHPHSHQPLDRPHSHSPPSSYPSHQQYQQQQQQQHSFLPQPSYGGNWGQEYASAVSQNPYYAAATGQLGLPEAYPPMPPQHHSQFGNSGDQQQSLRRTASSASSMRSYREGGARPGSTVNTLSSSSGTVRRRAPSGPPITKASVDEYRSRIKADPDPEAQFNFAKYLIEAAKKISSSASGDEKSAKRYRDALLAESLKLIKRLATQGAGLGKPAYADAQFFLANCLGNGSLGLSIDHEKAYNLYVQASKQNHSSATYRTAVCNEVGAGTRRDHARAVLFYRKASALGDTAGMYKLGMVLLNGLLGQQRNRKEAVAWLKRAASQADEDNPHSLHELGLLYESAPQPGQPGSLAASMIPYDPAQARELFTQAAQFGYAPSQFKLGSCYEYGSLTCPVDPRRSIAWYTRAAERGDAESELALSGWYLTGSEGVLKQSDSEAYLWARRAANKGLPKAEYAVGYYSEVGIGVKQDAEEAKRWYMRAAAQGNKRAMQRLTELKQLGVQRDKKSAARPTRQQAESECVVM